MRIALVAVFLVLGAAAAADANAHGPRGRVHFGIHLGAPWYPYWHPWPYYYQPAPIVVQRAEPPVYVERDEPPDAAAPQSWWYYCEQSKTYYPYVKSCPAGWQKVAPTPRPEGG